MAHTELPELLELQALAEQAGPLMTQQLLCSVTHGPQQWPVHAYTLGRADAALPAVAFIGGVHGLERGYCLMIGGKKEVADQLAPIFSSLAPGIGEIERTPARQRGLGPDDTAEHGWLHCGPSGTGHFVKMIHNGIEYGMMQAFAEGFALLSSAASERLPENRRFDLDCAGIAEVWRRGSVVTSWLLDLTADSLAETPDLAPYSSQVADSGEGRWTVATAVEQSVAAPVLTAALYERFRSRSSDGFGDKLLSAMRYKFGGHTAPAS